MKIRLISGTCYVLLLAGFFALKCFVHDFFFDGLIYAFALIGAFEMVRALKARTTKAERGIALAYSVVAVPFVALTEYFYGFGVQASGIAFFLFAFALLCLLVIRHEESTLESLGLALLSGVYPTLLLCLLSLVNHATPTLALLPYAFDSRLLILFIFVVSPCADSIAYVFGRCFKKYFPKKMSPKLSPNKTVIGGIGGLVGGMLGALVLYFIYNATVGSFENMYIWLPVYLFIGLFASVATAFGDLVESSIKRKVELKDMGKIMPGHGGALDRLDGTFFATVAVYLVFIVVNFVA